MSQKKFHKGPTNVVRSVKTKRAEEQIKGVMVQVELAATCAL